MKHAAHPDSILIIDFGSQVTQLIARRVREAGVYCEIHPFQNAAEAFERLQPKGVIFSGGPASVTTEGSPRAPQAVFDSGVPILGICYGQQTLAHQLGGTVEGGHAAEFGRADIEIKAASPLVSRSSRPPRTRPSPSPPTRAGATIRRCSTRRWCTRPTAPSCCRTSCTGSSG
jgi:GMP synthase (glutamine-hydrolysing)